MSANEIGIEQARKTLGDLADAAHHHSQTTVITRHGRAYAAIVPVNRIAEEQAMTNDPKPPGEFDAAEFRVTATDGEVDLWCPDLRCDRIASFNDEVTIGRLIDAAEKHTHPE